MPTFNYNPTNEELKPLIKAHCEKLNVPFNWELKEKFLDAPDLFKLMLDDKAYVVGLAAVHPFTGDKLGLELAIFTTEPGYGSTLLTSLEEWAQSAGLDRVVVTSQEAYPIGPWLERKGYQPKEHSYVKELR